MNCFEYEEKENVLRQQKHKIKVLAKQDYSIERVLPVIEKINILDENTWNSLLLLLPSAVFKASVVIHFE